MHTRLTCPCPSEGFIVAPRRASASRRVVTRQWISQMGDLRLVLDGQALPLDRDAEAARREAVPQVGCSDVADERARGGGAAQARAMTTDETEAPLFRLLIERTNAKVCTSRAG